MEPSEGVLRGLLAAAPDALLAVDSDGKIVFVNDQAERLFGWPRAELVGEPVETLIPQRFRRGHPGLRDAFIAHPTTRPMGAGLELWARHRDGTEFPAEISLSGLHTAEGTLVAAAIRDVTLTRRADQRVRAVLASAPDAIVGVDAAGHIELLNEQAERLFGWSADEVVGKQIEILVPAAAEAAHVGHRAGYVANPSPRPMGAGRQLSGRRKDGSSFPAEISLSAVTDGAGSLLVLAAVRDVTERLEVHAERERQALAAQREQSHRLESLGQLAGGVAHDFNNLLGVILNYSTVLVRRVTDPVALSDLGEIRAAAERGAALTRQLLTFARRDVVNADPLDLNEVVRGVASMLDRTVGEHVDLRLNLRDDMIVVLADRRQLEQVILNLAINARDAMPMGGTLMIATTTREHGGAVAGLAAEAERDAVLSVTDTGQGMTDDIAARAFDPFFTTKPLSQGTGLGLAMVHGIVAQNGGEVAIESSIGGGTTVIVTLPLTVDTCTVAEPAAPTAEGGHERILLVEDEPALRVVTARMLAERGYAVVTAADGVEALEILQRSTGTIDLLVTDIAMPKMNGDELARQLIDRHIGLPVVFLTGHAAVGPQSTAGRVLAKPVALDDLLRTIREALDG